MYEQMTHRRSIKLDGPILWFLLDIRNLPAWWRSTETSPQVAAEVLPDFIALVLPEL
jgi:hypothetical protein